MLPIRRFLSTLWLIAAGGFAFAYPAAAQGPPVFTPPPLPEATPGLLPAAVAPEPAPANSETSNYPQTNYPQTTSPDTPLRTAMASTRGNAQPVAGGRIIALINGEVVLEGDLMWQANQLIQANAASIPPEQVDKIRQDLIRYRLLPGIVDTKLLYSELRKIVPPDRLKEIRKKFVQNFEQKVLPGLIEQYEVETRSQLDALLRKQESSLTQQQTAFIEQELAKTWLQQQINYEPEISLNAIRADYRGTTRGVRVCRTGAVGRAGGSFRSLWRRFRRGIP